ncbi:unnamed protein product [Mucor circinelloides]
MSLANSLKTNKIPQTLAETRVEQLSRLVANQCPSHHVDFYVFTIAVLCVICSAIFTFVARSLHISMWCPLLLLLIPTALSFWTSKRRSTLIIKIKEVVNRYTYGMPTILTFEDKLL